MVIYCSICWRSHLELKFWISRNMKVRSLFTATTFLDVSARCTTSIIALIFFCVFNILIATVKNLFQFFNTKHAEKLMILLWMKPKPQKKPEFQILQNYRSLLQSENSMNPEQNFHGTKPLDNKLRKGTGECIWLGLVRIEGTRISSLESLVNGSFKNFHPFGKAITAAITSKNTWLSLKKINQFSTNLCLETTQILPMLKNLINNNNYENPWTRQLCLQPSLLSISHPNH